MNEKEKEIIMSNEKSFDRDLDSIDDTSEINGNYKLPITSLTTAAKATAIKEGLSINKKNNINENSFEMDDLIKKFDDELKFLNKIELPGFKIDDNIEYHDYEVIKRYDNNDLTLSSSQANLAPLQQIEDIDDNSRSDEPISDNNKSDVDNISNNKIKDNNSQEDSNLDSNNSLFNASRNSGLVGNSLLNTRINEEPELEDYENKNNTNKNNVSLNLTDGSFNNTYNVNFAAYLIR